MTSVRSDKVTTCLEGAAPGFVPASAEEVREMRRQFGLPDKYILYAGSNKPHKNLKGLLQAWKLLRSRGGATGVKLAIAGVWLEEHALPEKDLEDVVVLGRVSDDALRGLYSGALAFVFPTFYEGFGLPVLEAMACDTPVLCSNRASLPEVAGDAALYFDPNNPAEMAERIDEVVESKDKRSQLRNKGRLRLAELTWDRCAACTLEIYRSQAK